MERRVREATISRRPRRPRSPQKVRKILTRGPRQPTTANNAARDVCAGQGHFFGAINDSQRRPKSPFFVRALLRHLIWGFTLFHQSSEMASDLRKRLAASDAISPVGRVRRKRMRFRVGPLGTGCAWPSPGGCAPDRRRRCAPASRHSRSSHTGTHPRRHHSFHLGQPWKSPRRQLVALWLPREYPAEPSSGRTFVEGG